MSERPPSLDELRSTELFARLRTFGAGHSFEENHALQVAKLSLELFDLTTPVHRMGPPERRLLFCAALVHDVGLCRGVSGHHKRSLELVMAGSLSPLTDRERRMVANIARYHRKAHPRRKHDHFAALEENDQRAVAGTAALLRMADALDRAHGNCVKDIDVEMSTRKVVIKAVAARELDVEKHALRKKAALFEELFGLKVDLETVRPGEGK